MSRFKHSVVLRAGIPVLVALALAGCPSSLAPRLSVSPSAVSFGSDGVEESIGIRNTGSGAIAWSVVEDIPWLTCDVTGGTVQQETDRVTLTVSRTNLGPGDYSGFVTIESDSGSKAIPVAMRVPGTPQLTVSPQTVNLLGTQTTGDVTLTNNGDEPFAWTLTLVDPANPGSPIEVPEYLTVTPGSGTVPAGGSATFQIEIDRELLGEEPVTLALRITSDGGTAIVTVNVSSANGATLVVDPQVLDFGKNLSQLTFDVYNGGPAGSELDFTVSTDRPEFIFLNPTMGQSVGTTELVKDKVTIGVTLDRAAMTGAQDSGHVYVSAPGFDPVEVLVKAEAAPITFEGALNRTRPPFILRFIFLLRDSAGRAIDSNNAGVLEELQTAFTIYEDGVPLDTDETNLFVQNGLNLKYNVALLLDYTGSMYNAGDGAGSAIAQMVSSAGAFIEDLPPSYRVAVMEYHERQQANRLVHGFSTSRDSLVDALNAFQVPPAEHGASEILDAIVDACQRFDKEDENTLPFDDADVRALVFISDGRDTSSIAKLEETIKAAQDARVRLYPIGFGQGINSSMLVQLATETGGHYYAAPTVADLKSLLEHETGTPEATPGLVVTELGRQVVLTYITLWQEDTHTYMIHAGFRGQEGYIDRDGVYSIGGDVRAGQIALTTSGIESDDTAEVYVRTDYVPRNVSQFRFRVITDRPVTVEPVADGLIADWVLVNEGGGVYTVLTTEDRPLRYGAFGNLLKLSFADVDTDGFPVEFRVDNRIYVNPPFTKFFQYPLGIPVAREFSWTSSVAPLLLSDGFNPDAPDAFDHDKDSVTDFDDLNPLDPNLP